MDDDEEDFEPDPEITASIFNWLAYEISTKHPVGICPKTGDRLPKETRLKRRRGELCLCCSKVPKKGYDPDERFKDRGFCEPCLTALVEAGEYCTACKYAFDKHYMHDSSTCKLCKEIPDAPRLNP